MTKGDIKMGNRSRKWIPPSTKLRDVVGRKQYALVFQGQSRHHYIVGSNYDDAVQKAKRIALKYGTGVVITKEVAVIEYKRGKEVR